MIFYCPNCDTLEYPKISYTDRDFIHADYRDGYGLGLYYVICKTCSYPLSAVISTNSKKKDVVEYYKDIIIDYQNGYYGDKEDILNIIKNRYKENINIVKCCNKFLK